jgi:Cu/Ag efflux protein CusF
MSTITKIPGIVSLVFVVGFATMAYAGPNVKTEAQVASAAKVAPMAHSATASDWQHTTGEVVTPDIANNTLILKSHGKNLEFSVPGRISMLNLKPGDRVSLHYLAEGKQLRVWDMKTE